MKPATRRTTHQLWRYGLCVLLGLFKSSVSLYANAVRFTASATAVPDGDTLWAQAVNGGPPRKLHLQGIDAPEICQPGGDDARRAVQQLADGAPMQIEVHYTDDYGRGLARIHIGGQDNAAVMVQHGHA